MPSPRAMYGGYGALKIVVRVEPPGSDAAARSNRAAEPGVRRRYSSTRDVPMEPIVGPFGAAVTFRI